MNPKQDTSTIHLGILGAGQLAIMLALLPPPLRAATVQGKIIDPSGAAIDAYVFAFDNSKHPKTADPLPGTSSVADRNGHYSLILKPGFYDVCVFEVGFSASCRKVFLKQNDSVVLQNFKMKVDAFMSKELADRFPTR